MTHEVHEVLNHKLDEKISHSPSCEHHAILTPALSVLQSELCSGQSTAVNSCVHSVCVQSEQSEKNITMLV